MLYVANSDEHNVRAYDVDHNGDASNERVAISGVDGVPDGIRVDEKGNLYVAANGICMYDARGKLIENSATARDAVELRVRRRRPRDAVHYGQNSLYRVRRDVKGALQY